METAPTVFLRGALRLNQPARGYRFNVDSVLLAQFASVRAGEAVVDLGAGCGILLLLAGHFGHPRRLTGIELQPEMAELCRENLWENGWAEEGEALAADLREPGPLPEGAFHLAVANPPYHGAGRSQACGTAAKDAARRDASLSPDQLFRAADHLLAPDGRLCFIVPEPRREELLGVMAAAGFSAVVTRAVRPKPDREPYIHLVQARKGAARGVALPDLVLWEGPKRYAPEVRRFLDGERGPAPRFFADAMVGRLARHLRLAGYDCAFAPGAEDAWLLRECARSGRVLVTRDLELAGRAARTATACFDPGCDGAEAQLGAVVGAFGPPPDPSPRCLRCNARPLPLQREAALGLVPRYTWLTRRRFQACPCCGTLTWEGSHLERFRARMGGTPDGEEENRIMVDERERLRQLLKERSLKIGDFLLASGRRSKYYFDSKLTTLTSEGAYLTGRAFLQVIRENGVKADCIGGMTLGADPIVSAVAALSHAEGPALDAFIVRKEPKGHGTMQWIEGNVKPGQRAILVDDVVTTGGSTLKAIERAQEFGLEVVAVVALLDREEGGTEALSAKFPFYPVTRRTEIFGE